jgi:hypothetical protein
MQKKLQKIMQEKISVDVFLYDPWDFNDHNCKVLKENFILSVRKNYKNFYGKIVGMHVEEMVEKSKKLNYFYENGGLYFEAEKNISYDDFVNGSEENTVFCIVFGTIDYEQMAFINIHSEDLKDILKSLNSDKLIEDIMLFNQFDSRTLKNNELVLWKLTQ